MVLRTRKNTASATTTTRKRTSSKGNTPNPTPTVTEDTHQVEHVTATDATSDQDNGTLPDVLASIDDGENIEVVETQANPETMTRLYRQIGDYEIEVTGDRTRASFALIREGDVLLEQEVLPSELPQVAGKSKKLDALTAADLAAVSAYHQIVNTVDGLVDVEALAEHPLNSLIYGDNESVEDLVSILKEQDGQVFKIIINSQGQILSGNRRYKAALKVNQEFESKGLPPKFEFLSAEVVRFDSLESELKYMLLQNKSREKTPHQVANEIQALLALSSSSAVPSERKMQSSAIIEELRSRLGGGGGKVGRSTAFNLQAVYKKVETYKNEPLKDALRAYAVAMPNKAKDLVELEPPAEVGIEPEKYQGMVLKRLKDNPSESVERAASAVNREAIALKHKEKENTNENGSSTTTPENSNQADTTTADKIQSAVQTALAAGDKPSDNRRTPQEIIQLAFDVMGSIDLDSFAELSDPDRVGAAKSYTILDDAFSKHHHGNVFANPPFSKSGESISLMDAEICNGHIKKLFLILPVSVQSTKPYHRFIRSHSPLVFQPDKRLAFEPGDVLKSVEPSAKADGNREPSVILYWDCDQDYRNFYDHASQLGLNLQNYVPFNPVQIAVALSGLHWEKASLKTATCNVFGSTVEIEQDVDESYRVKVQGVLLPDFCPSLKVAKYLGIVTAIGKLAPETSF